jgi:hypothetical protein
LVRTLLASSFLKMFRKVLRLGHTLFILKIQQLAAKLLFTAKSAT